MDEEEEEEEEDGFDSDELDSYTISGSEDLEDKSWTI